MQTPGGGWIKNVPRRRQAAGHGKNALRRPPTRPSPTGGGQGGGARCESKGKSRPAAKRSRTKELVDG